MQDDPSEPNFEPVALNYETPGVLVRVEDGITFIRLRNPNMTGTPELAHIAAEMDGLLDRGADKLVMDFKYVRFVGSAALGLLIRLQKKVNLAKRKMVLSHTDGFTEMLKISRTAALFTLAADFREARKLFR